MRKELGMICGVHRDAGRNNVIVNFAIAALLKYREKGPSSERANNGELAQFICARLRRGGVVYFCRHAAQARRMRNDCEIGRSTTSTCPARVSFGMDVKGIKPPLPK